MIAQIYNGYLDETGTDSSKDVVAVAGWLGTYQAWVEFERRWREALPREAGGDFHYTDFWARKTYGADWSDQKRIAFVRTLAEIVSDHARIGLGIVVSKRVLEKVVHDEFGERLIDPVHFCLAQCLVQLLSWYEEVQLPRPPVPLRFMFDGTRGRRGALTDAYDHVREALPNRDQILFGDLASGSRKVEPALQAADLLVGELRRQGEGHPSAIIDSLRKKMNILVSFVSEESLRAFIERHSSR